jgi:aldehyde:ferredoxin oxidoreductase
MLTGLTATVDLTAGAVSLALTPERLVRAFLGGRGLNMAYLLRYLQPGIDPLGPANPLIVGAGLLTGTMAPASSRWNVTAKSPEACGFADANAGGFFGAALRRAGFDRLIILGRAPRPSLLLLERGAVRVLDATRLWGCSVPEAQDRLRQRFGGDIAVACIGPAGERLVRFAAVLHGRKNAAARGGLGAVMGSKNLKAIVARAEGKVPEASPGALRDYRRELLPYLARTGAVKVLGRHGTPFLYRPANLVGALRVRNAQANQFTDGLVDDEIDRHVERMVSCFNCPVHCRARNILGGEGPEYSAVGALGANLGIDDAGAVVRLNNRCNDLGLDASSAGTILGWAFELYERRLIDERLTGRPLGFGDPKLVEDLLEDTAERRGFGDVLAESVHAATAFGPPSGRYLIAVKGLPQSDPHDPRIVKSFALGIAVASRGADHLRNRPTLDFMNLPDRLRETIYGQPVDPEITSYASKEVMVAYHEDIYAVVDSLGLCKFVCHGFNSPHLLTYDHFAHLIELATGLRLEARDLCEVGGRIVDLERLLNQRLGLTAADDTLPPRYFDDPLPLGPYAGERIDRERFEAMRARYYRRRGWSEGGRLLPARAAEVKATAWMTT